MEDTAAQTAAMTGGYGSTYGAIAAQQGYDRYLSQLNDRVPQLEQMAYGKYTDELNDTYNRLGAYQGEEQRLYGQYLDALNQSNIDRDFSFNAMQAAIGQNNYENEFDRSIFESDRGYGMDKNAAELQGRQADIENTLAIGDYSKLRELGYDTNLAGAQDRQADLTARIQKKGKMSQTQGVFLNTEGITAEQKALAELVSKVGGMEVILVDELPQDANGAYTRGKGKIYIAMNSDSFSGALFHESTHYIREAAPEAYDKMQEAVFSMAASMEGRSTEEYIEHYKEVWGKNIENPMDVLEEMTADAFQKIAADEAGMRDFIQRMQNENPTLIERIKEFIEKLLETLEGLLKDNRFSDFAEELHKNKENTEKLRDIFVKSLKTAGENQQTEGTKKAETGEGDKSYLPEGETDGRLEDVAFSLKGKRKDGIEVYETGEEIKKLPYKGRMDTFLRLMQEEYKGRTAKFKKNEQVYYAKFDSEDIRKNIWGDKKSDKIGWKAKINTGADGSIFELVENTEYSSTKKETGKPIAAHTDVKEWDYFVKAVQIDGKVFDLLANIRKKSDGEYIYSIQLNENKKISADLPLEPAHNRKSETATLKIEETSTDKGIIAQKEGENNNREITNEVKFSMKEPLEETKDLIAIHNIEADNLKNALEIGGFPMPSIAIVKAETGHSKYGDISVVFDKNTIDPEGNKKNKVYSGDAWTPTVPRVDYEINYDVKKNFQNRIYELSGKTAGGIFRNTAVLGSLGINEETTKGKEEIIELLANNTAVQAAYLEDSGKKLEPVLKDKEFDKFGNEALKKYIDKIGYQRLEEIIAELETAEGGLVAVAERETELIREIMREVFYKKNKMFLDRKPELIEKRLKGRLDKEIYPARVEEFIRHAGEMYQDNGQMKGETDYSATRDALVDAVKKEDIKKWIAPQLEGLLGEAGIYNGKDAFTPAGNSRTFKQLHYAYTLENLVKAMQNTQKEKGEGLWGATASGLQAVSSKEYKSIADIKKDKDRLQHMDEGEYQERLKEIDAGIEEVISDIKRTNEPHSDNPYEECDIIGYVLNEAVKGKQTEEGIKRTFTKEGYTIGEETVKKVTQLFKDVAELPTGYFEAKPQRAIGFEEVRSVIVPDVIDGSLIEELEDRGVGVIFYKAGDEESRLEALNSLKDLKFSMREEEYEALIKENQRLTEANEALKRQFQITKDATHDPTSAKKAAKRWLKEHDSAYDSEQFAEKFLRLCDYVVNAGDHVDFQRVMGALQKLAYDALSESSILNTDLSDEYKDFKNDLRKTKIKVTENMMEEFGFYGGYNEIRKKNFGKINLSRQGGTAADVIYAELETRYPELLHPKEVITQVDMILDLIDVVDSLQPIYENPYGMNLDEAALDAAYGLWDLYFDIELQKPTFADKYEKKLEKERARGKAARKYLREEMKERYEAKLEEARKKELARLMSEGRKTAGKITKLEKHLEAQTEKTQEQTRKLNAVLEREELWQEAYEERLKEEREETLLVAAMHEGAKRAKAERQHRQELEGARKTGKWKLKEQKERYEERLEVLKNKKNEQLDEQRNRYIRAVDQQLVRNEELRERHKATRERQEYRQYRKSVEKNVKAMLKWIDNPTDKYHVPEKMLEGVKVFLKKIETSDEDITLLQNDFRMVLRDLKAMKADEDGVYIEYDESIETLLNAFDEAFFEKYGESVRLADMTAQEMKALRNITTSIRRTITEANRLFASGRNAKVSELAEGYIGETDKQKATNQAGTLRQLSDFFNISMLDAPSFFKEMGNQVYNSIYKGFREGFDRKIHHVAEAADYMKEIADEKTVRNWRMEAPEKFEINGKLIYLTIAQKMSLYCLMRRPQGRKHILVGGIKAEPDTHIIRKGRKEAAAALKAGTAVQTTEADIRMITDTLTEEQKEAALKMQEYLSQEVAEWGNETSMLMYGYEKFKDPIYFPIVSDQNYINRIFGDPNRRNRTLQSMGMTKSVSEFAKNPIILQDIFSVYTKHIDQMSSYNAFVPVMSDLNKFLNYKTFPDEEGIGKVSSVRESMERVMGPAGLKYIQKLMERINGAAGGDDAGALPRLFLRNMKIASVGANLRVIIQQPMSYIRAADLISPKYLTAALAAGKNDFKRIYKYAPIAQWKDWGNYEMNVGRSMEELITGQNFFQKFKEYTMAGAGLADRMTWGRLWKAAELETKEKYPELQEERFYQKVGERFTQIIDETQVVDSILHRSEMMRSKSLYTQMVTSFMSEPTKTYNMCRTSFVGVRKAQGELKAAQASMAAAKTEEKQEAAKKEQEAARERLGKAYKRLTRTHLTLVANGIAVAVAAGLVDAMRDDDDDETFTEKWIGAIKGDYREAETRKERVQAFLASNLSDSFLPMNYIPYLRDLMSLLQGYDVKRTDFDWAVDILRNMKRWQQYSAGENSYTLGAMILDTAGCLSKLTGIPMNSLKRDLLAIKDTIINHTIGFFQEGDNAEMQYENKKLRYDIGAEKNLSLYVKMMLEAKLERNTALATRIYNDMIKGGN